MFPLSPLSEQQEGGKGVHSRCPLLCQLLFWSLWHNTWQKQLREVSACFRSQFDGRVHHGGEGTAEGTKSCLRIRNPAIRKHRRWELVCICFLLSIQASTPVHEMVMATHRVALMLSAKPFCKHPDSHISLLEHVTLAGLALLPNFLCLAKKPLDCILEASSQSLSPYLFNPSS